MQSYYVSSDIKKVKKYTIEMWFLKVKNAHSYCIVIDAVISIEI